MDLRRPPLVAPPRLTPDPRPRADVRGNRLSASMLPAEPGELRFPAFLPLCLFLHSRCFWRCRRVRCGWKAGPLEVFGTIIDPLCPPNSSHGVRSVGLPIIQGLNTHLLLSTTECGGSLVRRRTVAGDNWYTYTSAMAAEIHALGASPRGAGVGLGQRSWAGRRLPRGHLRPLPASDRSQRALLVPGGGRGCLRSRLFQVSWR